MHDVAYYETPIRRSRMLAEACMAGFKELGIDAVRRNHGEFRSRGIEARVALFYGLAGHLQKIRTAHMRDGKRAILLDLGYWGRWQRDRYDGYHRFAIDSLHATPKGPMPNDRIERFNVRRRNMQRGGRHILLCGQSEKAAQVYRLQPNEWERRTVKILRQYTERPIWYMPKNSWGGKCPLPNTIYKDRPLQPLLDNAWAVVTHHSNSAVHALEEGVPVFVEDGAAKQLASGSVAMIEKPVRHPAEVVDQFLADVAYLQWTPKEMAAGAFWRHIEDWWL